MSRIYTDVSGGITETIRFDEGDNRIVVNRSEDVTPVLDAVAKANSHGTTEMPGLGRLVMEVPITLAILFCDDRGIPWEKFLYGNEYDDEFKRFAAEYEKLQYTHAKKYH